MYTDVFSAYSACLQQLLRICSSGLQYDAEFNPKMSVVMIALTNKDWKQVFPLFCLGDRVLNMVTKLDSLVTSSGCDVGCINCKLLACTSK